MENIILYGAGINLPGAYSKMKDSYNIVCIVDKDENKQGTKIEMLDETKLSVLSIENALMKFPSVKIWITPAVPVKYEIITELIAKQGIDKDLILNYEAVTFKRGCELAETMLTFGQNYFQVCCTGREAPHIWFHSNKTYEEIWGNIESFRENLINSISTGNEPPLCKNCQYIKEKFYYDKRQLNWLNFAPGGNCQFNCCYCTSADYYKTPPNKESIKKAIEFIAFLKNKNYIEKNARMQLVNGEITLSPFKKEIFKIVEGLKLEIATNGEFYSKEIEDSLHACNAVVNISIDAGTAETFKVAKGRDCFDKVVENARKYGVVAQPGAFQLKYIILPRINDNQVDAKGFVALACEAKADIVISRNMYDVKAFDDNIESCLDAAEIIISDARSKGLTVFNQINDFSPSSKFKNKIRRLFTEL